MQGFDVPSLVRLRVVSSCWAAHEPHRSEQESFRLSILPDFHGPGRCLPRGRSVKIHLSCRVPIVLQIQTLSLVTSTPFCQKDRSRLSPTAGSPTPANQTEQWIVSALCCPGNTTGRAFTVCVQIFPCATSAKPGNVSPSLSTAPRQQQAWIPNRKSMRATCPSRSGICSRP